MSKAQVVIIGLLLLSAASFFAGMMASPGVDVQFAGGSENSKVVACLPESGGLTCVDFMTLLRSMQEADGAQSTSM